MSDSLMAPTKSYSCLLVGAAAFSSVAWSAGAQLVVFICFRFPVVLFGSPWVSGCRPTRCAY